jgi:hypothetical protein
MGESADLRKGSYHSREVAVKVLRVDLSDDLGKVKRVSFLWCSRFVFMARLTVPRWGSSGGGVGMVWKGVWHLNVLLLG